MTAYEIVTDAEARRARLTIPAISLPSIRLAGLLPYLLPAVVLGVWQLLSSVGWISSRIMPAPTDVGLAFVDQLSSGSPAA